MPDHQDAGLPDRDVKILLPGGAGLVGQNLVALLAAQGYRRLVVLDKHRGNLDLLRKMHPEIVAELADLAEPGAWQRHFADAEAVVMLQAQIGSNDYQQFVRNNLMATRLILDAIRTHDVPRLVHVSSSVLESVANDFYASTKAEQERMVLGSGIACQILRPTLMFGWFDRKHFGWLSRFMQKVPVFPIPGDGRYMRQPLYAGDFCRIIASCLDQRIPTGIYNISGHEQIDYIDIIREIRRTTGAKTSIVCIPYSLFAALLRVWGWFDRNPPFTAQQLTALVARDEFEVTDWPGIFGVPRTPFAEAIDLTFNDPRYSRVVLKF